MPQYKDIDEILKNLPDDLPYKASVKRVLIQAPTADVAPKREVLRLQSFKELIKSRGVTQAELAAMVGCSQRAITHWISGRNLPTLKEAYLLAYVLGITLDELATIFLYGERKTTDGMSTPKER